ncbi:MAG: hypothetical protein FJX67_08310 [Alphaproteobacteria bacterium]|nr:hypothetical protein [Alphaproteobacteria bacterium]
MNAMPQWRTHEELPLSRESLEALYANEIPAIRIRDFVTADEARRLAAAMDAIGFTKQYNIPALKNPARYIGVTQFEFRKKSKADYFAAVAAANAEKAAYLAAAGVDPFARLFDRVRALYPERTLSVAEEPGHDRYYVGIIRESTGGGTLHADTARFSAPDYAIARCIAQLSWNLFVSEPAAGGVTTVHNAPYTPPSEDGRYAEIEPFNRRRVEGAETHRYKGRPGEVIIFNPRNPHEWTANESGDGTRRLSVGSYIGRLPEGDFIVWS